MFFHFFKIVIFWVVRGERRGGEGGGVKGQTLVQILSVILHISGTIHHMIAIYGTLVLSDNISICFFDLFKIFIFWVVRGVKRQKKVQNDKKFCLLRSISQEPYIIWLSFILHTCRIIISPGIFFLFSHFNFLGC